MPGTCRQVTSTQPYATFSISALHISHDNATVSSFGDADIHHEFTPHLVKIY
jgi:hypothetical protein